MIDIIVNDEGHKKIWFFKIQSLNQAQRITYRYGEKWRREQRKRVKFLQRKWVEWETSLRNMWLYARVPTWPRKRRLAMHGVKNIRDEQSCQLEQAIELDANSIVLEVEDGGRKGRGMGWEGGEFELDTDYNHSDESKTSVENLVTVTFRKTYFSEIFSTIKKNNRKQTSDGNKVVLQLHFSPYASSQKSFKMFS